MAAFIQNHIYQRCFQKYRGFILTSRKLCLFSKYSGEKSKQCTSKIFSSGRIVLFANTDSLCARFQSTGKLFEATSNSTFSPMPQRFAAIDKKAPDATTQASCNNELHSISLDRELSSQVVSNSELHGSSPFSSSSELQNTVEHVVDYIPEPPLPPQLIFDNPELTSTIIDRLEPTLVSQGLGGWSPVGLLQHLLDWIHISMGLPWWGSIVVATLIARTLMFPLFVKSQKNMVNMNNNMPQMQVLQLKITEARKNGNAMDVMRYSNELSLFMQEKNCNPFKSFLVPLAQAPIFISFFLGLRKMANLPIESFKEGGMFWFTDLTVTDPYFLLPIITSVTLFITIELGSESGIQANQIQAARYFMRAIPLIMFPFIINFPAALLCYWVTTNGFTLLQVGFVKIPKVRQFLNIPAKVQHNPNNMPIKKKGFVESIKETLENSKITREMEDRTRVDAIRFRKAGMGPVPKTYAYDPTKQRKN